MYADKTTTPDLIETLAYAPHYTERYEALRQLLTLPAAEKETCRRYFLGNFSDWATEEAEEPYCPQETVQCVDFLQRLLKGDLNITHEDACMERTEPFSAVADTLNLAIYLGLETNGDALDSAMADSAEAALRCPQCNGPIINFMALVLVIRLLHDFRIQHVLVPVPLERQLRIYFLLSLSAAPTECALTWAMGDAA